MSFFLFFLVWNQHTGCYLSGTVQRGCVEPVDSAPEETKVVESVVSTTFLDCLKQTLIFGIIGSSVSRAEHTTFDLGMRDGSPRVVSFSLPSYLFMNEF